MSISPSWTPMAVWSCGGKSKRRIPPFLELDVVGVVLPDVNLGVWRLRQQQKQWQQRILEGCGSVLRLFHPYLQVGAPRDGGLSCGCVRQRGDLPGGLILLSAQVFERLLAPETLAIQAQHVVNIHLHALDFGGVTVLVRVFAKILEVDHVRRSLFVRHPGVEFMAAMR